jgi:hypothetical protein
MIWTAHKIWNETQWFDDIDVLINNFKDFRKKILSNNFWKKGKINGRKNTRKIKE